jgi:hypothetical protein
MRVAMLTLPDQDLSFALDQRRHYRDHLLQNSKWPCTRPFFWIISRIRATLENCPRLP